MRPFLICLLAALATAADTGAFELAAPPAGDPAATVLPAGKPWIPGWCRWDWRAAWVGHHQGFVANTTANAGRIDVVFYGDSITQGWGDGVKKLDRRLNIVNYGIGGDSTRQILYRASRGELAGIAPRLVVLAIGTNNLYDDANGGSDEEIVRGLGACVGLIKAASPSSNVLVCSILPRQNDWFCGRIRRINAQVRLLDNGRDIRFLDTFEAFFDGAAVNRVKEDLFRDGKGKADWLHIGPKGYERWAELIAPLFGELTR
jgi:beta-glucosidase